MSYIRSNSIPFQLGFSVAHLRATEVKQRGRNKVLKKKWSSFSDAKSSYACWGGFSMFLNLHIKGQINLRLWRK